MRRRAYLSAVAAGLATGAGCSAIQGGGADDEATPTASQTPTPTEPDVALLDASPGALKVEDGDVVDLHMEVRNEGAAGAVPLEVALGGETVVERSMNVDGGRHVEEVQLEDVADGVYEYSVTVGDETASGRFTVGTPVEKPRVVTSHTVLGTEARSTPAADRLHVDVEVPGDPYNGVAPPGHEALLDICRKLILDELESTNRDALRIAIWRESQTAGDDGGDDAGDDAVGDGSPHAIVTWGPNGDWSGEQSGPDGDYSTHEFDIAGAQYLVTDGVEDVETDRWSFTVEFDVVNQGLERETLEGSVSTPETPEHRFAVDLEPGERSTVRYDSAAFGAPNRTHYTIQARGGDQLYGQRSAEIRFS